MAWSQALQRSAHQTVLNFSPHPHPGCLFAGARRGAGRTSRHSAGPGLSILSRVAHSGKETGEPPVPGLASWANKTQAFEASQKELMQERRPHTERAASEGLGDPRDHRARTPVRSRVAARGLEAFRTQSQHLRRLLLPLTASGAVSGCLSGDGAPVARP